jgi:hypothetical protein
VAILNDKMEVELGILNNKMEVAARSGKRKGRGSAASSVSSMASSAESQQQQQQQGALAGIGMGSTIPPTLLSPPITPPRGRSDLGPNGNADVSSMISSPAGSDQGLLASTNGSANGGEGSRDGEKGIEGGDLDVPMPPGQSKTTVTGTLNFPGLASFPPLAQTYCTLPLVRCPTLILTHNKALATTTSSLCPLNLMPDLP